MRNIIFTFLLLSPIFALAEQLKPFTTDGCSSFPDGTLEHQSLWVECCLHHDLSYWKGGTYEERLESDKALQTCVAKVGEPEIANIMLAGVRAGGSPYYPTPFRWGYGWPYLRGYKKLSPDEKLMVLQRIKEFKVIISSIENKLR